jgi:O-antigen/teichoic acid export membrane protein
MGGGGLFLVLQIVSVIGWEMDPVLIAALVGPAAVATYSVVQQMFMLVSGPLAMLNGSLWGSYAEAYARRDVSYLKTTLRYSVLGTVGFALVGAAVLLAVYGPLAYVLTRGTLHPPGSFVLIFAAWTVVSATAGAFAAYMNGLHILVPQAIAWVAFVLLAIVLKLALIGPYGLDGVVAATLLSYVVAIVLPYLTVFRGAITAPLRAAASDSAVLG